MNGYKLTKELEEIMKHSKEFIETYECKDIPIEAFVFFVVKTYIETDEKDLENKILSGVFKSLKDDDKNLLTSGCLDLLNNYCAKNKFSGPIFLYNSENIPLSPELERALDRSKLDTEYDLSYRNLVSGNDIIGSDVSTIELFISILSEKDNKAVELLSSYGIDKSRLITKYINNSIEKDFTNSFNDFFGGGVFKEKKLDFNNPKFIGGDPKLFEAMKDLFGENIASALSPNSPIPPENQQTPKESPEEEDNTEEDTDKKDEEEFEKAGESGSISTKRIDPNSTTPTLDEFAVNMTQLAKEGKYDPIVGRDKELHQLFEILSCRKKNSAILLGDPGCGKTALVELLAQRISDNSVPLDLRNRRVLSLSTTDLTAGTMYRGQLEDRIKNLCEELAKNKDIILYIDEFQQATSENSTSIAQMLKPALGRGELTLIASTTVDEYRKFIEKDGALKRRLSPIQMDEPTVEETINILRGIQHQYSKYHHVKYTDDVLVKCAEWSGKYINDKFFPDKAITILDLSSSLAKLNRIIDESKLNELRDKVEDLSNKKIEAVNNVDLDLAEKYRIEEESAKSEYNKELEKFNGSDESLWPTVTLNEVSSVISKTTGVPIDKIMSSDFNKLREIKNSLSKKVIGQEEAVEQLTLALQRNVLGLRDPNKPIASFLLVGPTGVGKSLISKIIATEFMGSEKNLITIACSEYMQDWAESKLLGSAPGYVGFSDSEPRLYILKRKPYSVILIDEVEKSSSNLYNIWLNMLEEGEVTLSSGEKVSCRNSIIIFTGNVGTKNLELHKNNLGFGEPSKEEKRAIDKSIVMKSIEKEFRPEFRNRISKIIIFNSLGKEELGKIFYLELEKLQNRLKENGYTLNVSDDIRDLIVSKCEPEYGARSLQRLITTYVEDEVCKSMLDLKEEDLDKKEINVSRNMSTEDGVNVVFA